MRALSTSAQRTLHPGEIDANLATLSFDIRGGDLVQFAFATQSLRKLCINAQVAERKLGRAVAALLRHRLSDLRAAENVMDIPIGAPTPMPIKGELGVDLGEYILVFRANHNPVPRSSTKGTDWSRVSRIQILRIEAKSSGGVHV